MRRRNTTPVLQHTREPNVPPPLPGCHCEVCENAKDDLHWGKVGELLGLDDREPKTEGQ